MLTAHECVRALAELRAATPRVTYRWPHAPESVCIETPSLFVLLYPSVDGAWIGWATRRREFLPHRGSPWLGAAAGRFLGELDGILAGAGIAGTIDRASFGQMPF